jgi:hypothetical protein
MKTLNLRATWMIAMALLFAVSVVELAHPTIACAIGKLLCRAPDGQSTDITHAWRAVALISLYAFVHTSTRSVR